MIRILHSQVEILSKVIKMSIVSHLAVVTYTERNDSVAHHSKHQQGNDSNYDQHGVVLCLWFQQVFHCWERTIICCWRYTKNVTHQGIDVDIFKCLWNIVPLEQWPMCQEKRIHILILVAVAMVTTISSNGNVSMFHNRPALVSDNKYWHHTAIVFVVELLWYFSFSVHLKMWVSSFEALVNFFFKSLMRQEMCKRIPNMNAY